MDAEQRGYLQKRYRTSDFASRGKRSHGVIKDFNFDGSEIPRWKMQRIRRDQRARPPVIHSIWSQGDSTDQLLAIDVFECSSVKAAHDQLIEAIGNMESDALNRRSDKGSPGEIAVGLGDTMILFSRSNVVALIRNAGPTVVPVDEVARKLDALLVRQIQTKR
jgi:hypothetical protein